MQPRLLDTVSESLRLWSDEHNRNDGNSWYKQEKWF